MTLNKQFIDGGVSPNLLSNPEQLKQEVPYVGELMLGHVRYGTFGKNNIESVPCTFEAIISIESSFSIVTLA